MFEYSVILKAILLGIIEGITEFVPISSTAHLIIFSQLIDFNVIKNNVFEIAIQIGAMFAIAAIYYQKFNNIFLKFYTNENKKFIDNISIAFFPAVIIGLVFHELIKKFLFSNIVIAISLLSGGLIMVLVEKHKKKYTISNINDINRSTALKIGIFQCLAMIPGVSRSGATILGGLLCGINRKVATEFSFFLAVPTIGSDCLYDIYQNINILSFEDIKLIIIGILSSFISSLIIIKWLIKYVSTNDFKLFGYYRIAIGLIIMIFFI